MKKILKGIIAPALAPCTADGALDEEAFRGLLVHLRSGGVQRAFVGGTTGEFVNYSGRERQRQLELAVDELGTDGVLYNITAMNRAELEDHIAAARSLGVEAVSVTAPYYHRYDSQAMTQYFSTVSRLTEGLYLYLYNMPDMTGNPVPPRLVAQLMDICPNLRGIKDSSMNYTNLEELCLLSCDRPFEVITGNDAEILPALELGCPGAIVALANPYPELCVEICERFRAGDRETAWMIQKLLVRVRNACRATVPVVSHKYLLELRGIPAGAAHFPMRELTEAEKSLLRSAAEAAQAVLSTCCSLAQPNKII